jgi:hypothetical protein
MVFCLYHDTSYLLGCVSKITKAHFRRLNLHIFFKKPRRSTTAPAFFVSICKPIQQNCIVQTLETRPGASPKTFWCFIMNKIFAECGGWLNTRNSLLQQVDLIYNTDNDYLHFLEQNTLRDVD